MFLPIRCLATRRGYTYRHRLLEEFIKCADEMRSGAIIVHTKFNKDWFRHSKFDRGGYTVIQHGDLISLLLFSQNKESRLKVQGASKILGAMVT
jgi:hypothetical protein